jgi:hypothetical protein
MPTQTSMVTGVVHAILFLLEFSGDQPGDPTCEQVSARSKTHITSGFSRRYAFLMTFTRAVL